MFIDETGTVSGRPTAGADEARAEMTDTIRAEAVNTIIGLVGGVGASLVAALTPDGATVDATLARLDANGDGLITVDRDDARLRQPRPPRASSPSSSTR